MHLSGPVLQEAARKVFGQIPSVAATSTFFFSETRFLVSVKANFTFVLYTTFSHSTSNRFTFLAEDGDLQVRISVTVFFHGADQN